MISPRRTSPTAPSALPGRRSRNGGRSGPVRLVYIPTHRPFDEVLLRVADEIEHAAAQLPDRFRLLLIDDRDDSAVTRSNRDAAHRVARNASFDVLWMGTRAWNRFMDLLLQHADLDVPDARFVRSALEKPTGSYAGGMNKASLLAVYMDADSLHRRDSDEIPGIRSADSLTALHIEAAVLGGSAEVVPGWSGQAPYFVGSSVEGEPTKDRRDLYASSPDLVGELDRISSRRKAHGVADPRVSDRHRLVVGSGVDVEVDVTSRTEVGVSATRRVFSWIPEMPAIGVLGTDHFQKGLLYRLDLPVLWHPIAPWHSYDPSRTQQDNTASLRRYICADYRHVVLKQYWNAANDKLSAMAARLLTAGGDFQSRLYAAAFREVLDECDGDAAEAADAFIDVYRRAAEQAAGPVRARHEVRVGALNAERGEVVEYVKAALHEFVALIELWPRLVGAARAAGAATFAAD
ncbi:DUF6271 family protein [Streptomyces sp. NBC_01538]|uniref:DUF6271 family protein n=1 Tax=Streptomyces sp. NBC_01538 TaxID=2903897 RepID=UPI00386B47AF